MPRTDVMTSLAVGSRRFHVRPTVPADHADLHAAFAQVVAAGEGYPQDPREPVPWDDFEAYWLAPARASFVVRAAGDAAGDGGGDDGSDGGDDGAFAGAYTMKPNGPGRAAHVANAGYLVVPRFRGLGLGTALVEHSFATARALGFDAMQFNLVFAGNPARRLYERLGFAVVGRVPEVIDGEDVYVYWRRLDGATPPT